MERGAGRGHTLAAARLQLLCPQNSSRPTSIELEMAHVIDWARENKMSVNPLYIKTVELVFRRLNISNDIFYHCYDQCQKGIGAAKLLGVHLTQNLTFSHHHHHHHHSGFLVRLLQPRP